MYFIYNNFKQSRHKEMYLNHTSSYKKTAINKSMNSVISMAPKFLEIRPQSLSCLEWVDVSF